MATATNRLWLSWLRECMRDPHSPINLPPELTLGALTGQDIAVLDAIAACWWAHAYDAAATRGSEAAIAALLPALQRGCWPFARELIAYALDWSDRERLWPRVAPGAK